MKRMMMVACLALAHAAFADGFFYAIEPVNGLDRLYRIDMSEDWQETTVTPIGDEGALGFPEVAGLVWDSDAERLYGYDQLLDLWLEIHTSTGEATVIGPFDRTVDDMTYNPADGLVYARAAGSVYAIDPSTGENWEAFDSGGCANGIAHVFDTTGGFDGLYMNCSFGLRLYIEPDWTFIDFGGDIATRSAMFWDAASDTLCYMDVLMLNDMYSINQVTGNETLIADWDLPIDVTSIVFVPGDPQPQPACTSMDADNDGDIDLIDFAEFQACFTGAE